MAERYLVFVTVGAPSIGVVVLPSGRAPEKAERPHVDFWKDKES